MYILELHREKRHRRLKFIIILFGVVVLGLGSWQAWIFAQPHYRHWKQRRALVQAREFIEKRDAVKARMALEVALNVIPGNPDALRVVAEMLEQVGSLQAIRVRRSVMQLLPNSAEDSAAMVMCALRFHDINAARDALSSTPPAVANKPVALRSALAFALATNDSAMADVIITNLRTLEPQDQELKLLHAFLLLKHPRQERQDQARRDLEDLRQSQPHYDLRILREFTGVALQAGKLEEARKWLTLTLAHSNSSFSDRLQLANIELLIDKKPFEQIFQETAPLALKNIDDAQIFIQWLMVQNRAKLAEQWLSQLPSSFRDSSELRTIGANLAAQAKDWDRFSKLLEDGAWGPITHETLTLAMAARTMDGVSREDLRREAWDATINSANNAPGTLRVLYQIASLWRWEKEAELVLWKIAKGFPDQTWAHQTLFNLYREKGNTNSLRDVLSVQRSSDVTVARYQHDWALLTLLTEPTKAWNHAKDVMLHLYESEPLNSNYITGYAFALAQAGKSAEALALIEKLPVEQRNYPPRQPYLAYIYGINHRDTDLQNSISIAQKVRLLPEEQKLLVKAQEEARRPFNSEK